MLRCLGFRGERFRDGLVIKAHRLLHHSTLGLRVLKKKKRRESGRCGTEGERFGGGSRYGRPARCCIYITIMNKIVSA